MQGRRWVEMQIQRQEADAGCKRQVLCVENAEAGGGCVMHQDEGGGLQMWVQMWMWMQMWMWDAPIPAAPSPHGLSLQWGLPRSPRKGTISTGSHRLHPQALSAMSAPSQKGCFFCSSSFCPIPPFPGAGGQPRSQDSVRGFSPAWLLQRKFT